RQRMRRAEFAGPRAELAPLLDELAIARELHDPRIGVGARTRELAAVSVRDEDVAVGCRDDVVRLLERVGAPRPSVTQTLPSRSTWMPCGKPNCPRPKLASSLPLLRSNLRIGSTFEPAQLFAPQRS